MPNQLFSSTPESGGDDRPTVGSRLPMSDSEFAELLQSIQSTPSNWEMLHESRDHSKSLNPSDLATLPSQLQNWIVDDCFRNLPVISQGSQMRNSTTRTCAGEDFRDNVAIRDWSDFENESSTLCDPMDTVEDIPSFIVSTKDFKGDSNPSDSNPSLNLCFDQIPLTPTLSLQSPQPPSPISPHENEDQNEWDWSDYICIPNDKPASDNNELFSTENTKTLTPPASCQGSPSIPSAQDPHTSTSASTTPPAGSSIVTRPTIHKTSIQKRQKVHPIATAHLRPKFNPILPNPNNANATPLQKHPQDQTPKQTQDKPTGRATKRSSMTDEEGLRKRRNYQRIAEQSRRLRLNSALKDLEALLPSDLVREKEQTASETFESIAKKDTKKEAKSKKPSAEQTKACVMELAVEYIKMLRTNLNEKNVRMQELGAVGTSILL